MQMQATAGYAGGQIPNPYMAYGAPTGFAPLTDEAGVYLPTGPGDAQRMELLNMPGDGSDVWLDVRTVQLWREDAGRLRVRRGHRGASTLSEAAVPRCKGAPRRGSGNDSTSKAGDSMPEAAKTAG